MARLVAITACPTGIAHTLMAAEALMKSARLRGHSISSSASRPPRSLRTPHGGVFVLAIPGAVSPLLTYVLAILSGTVVTALLLAVLKRPVPVEVASAALPQKATS